uniref:large ribosomal subunit protein uL16m n=1 Tax=Pristiophorus japonicus TaxID=55135 RepID=UPI00398F2D15
MALLVWRLGRVLRGVSGGPGAAGPYQNYTNVLSVGLKTYGHPPSYNDVIIPEKPKLKFVNKVPNYKKPRRWMKRLGDIRGPATRANTIAWGQYGIVVSVCISPTV